MPVPGFNGAPPDPDSLIRPTIPPEFREAIREELNAALDEFHAKLHETVRGGVSAGINDGVYSVVPYVLGVSTIIGGLALAGYGIFRKDAVANRKKTVACVLTGLTSVAAGSLSIAYPQWYSSNNNN